MIRVRCIACNRLVRGGDDWAGKIGQCPNCQSLISFPAAISAESLNDPVVITEELPPVEVRECPYCAEHVLAAAKKCRHCGEWFDEQARRKRQVNPGVAAVLSLVIPGAGQMYRGDVGMGIMCLVVTIIGYCCFVVPGIAIHLYVIAEAADVSSPTGSAPPPPVRWEGLGRPGQRCE